MPHLNLYIDHKLEQEIQRAAEIEHCSKSKWVRKKLELVLKSSDWPENYFELFGALKDSDIERPNQSGFDKDTIREAL